MFFAERSDPGTQSPRIEETLPIVGDDRHHDQHVVSMVKRTASVNIRLGFVLPQVRPELGVLRHFAEHRSVVGRSVRRLRCGSVGGDRRVFRRSSRFGSLGQKIHLLFVRFCLWRRGVSRHADRIVAERAERR